MYKKISLIQLEKIKEGLERDFEKQGKSIKCPTYSVVLPGGGKQTYRHTRESAEESGELNIWENYTNNLNEFNSLLQHRIMEYAFSMGVDCEVTNEWRERQEWLGIEYPNRFSEKAAFVMTEIFVTPEELRDGFLKIMQLSGRGVDQSVVQAAEATFRTELPEG